MGRLFKLGTVIFAASVSLPAVQSNQDCERQLLKSEGCFKKMLLLGDRDQSVPQNGRQMDDHCKLVKSSMSCFKSYSKCLKDSPKHMFDLLSSNLNSLSSQRCSKNGKRDFVRHMSCVTHESVKLALDRHVINFAMMMDYIARNVTQQEKLKYTCCSYFDMSRRMSDEIETRCPKSRPESKDYMKQSMTSLVSEIMGRACVRFDSTQSCSKMAPDAMKNIAHQWSRFSMSQNRFRLSPLIRLTQNLEERD